MEILPDKEINIGEKFEPVNKLRYIASSKHRETTNPKKSYWTIEYIEELQCFINCYQKDYNYENLTWGLINENSILRVLGKNNFDEELKIAKFIDSSQNDLWHGYPADYRRKNQDRPNIDVLKKWVNENIITKAKMLKIRQGQKCNL